jgi:hypothetical protein
VSIRPATWPPSAIISSHGGASLPATYLDLRDLKVESVRDITTRAGALTNLPFRGKVVSTQVKDVMTRALPILDRIIVDGALEDATRW